MDRRTSYLAGNIPLFLVFALGWGVSAESAEAAPVYVAGQAENRAQLINASQCRTTSLAGSTYLEIEADGDPYSMVSWQFEFAPEVIPEGREFVLEISYYDKGAGIIVPKLAGYPVSRQQGYTRLNTLQDRRALFLFASPSARPSSGAKAILVITGLQYLKSFLFLPALSESEWREARDAVPVNVKPMVQLERPMDLVVTAGVASMGTGMDPQGALNSLHELAPLAKVLGFNAVELYVRWNLIEPEREGTFDFTYYDALVAKLQEYDLKWFPLLIIGSAYALPDWFSQSEESVGFVCLEHGIPNLIQSIWSPYHQRHVSRVLTAFGEHYEPTQTLQGIRLGPTGNYGESQYPAGGNWPAKGQSMHIHIGFWCADDYAQAGFRSSLASRYGSIARLNEAWSAEWPSFDDISMVLPVTMMSRRQRIDFTGWYTRSMSDWCAWWAQEARRAMPNTKIYQSAGGWGFLEAGTSYSDQTKAMAKLNGGIRLTNETDSFEQTFYATRLATTAARLYGVDLGFEPASSHTARGVAGRIFNTTSTNGDHLFTYHSNIFSHQMAIDQWLEYVPILDTRQDPIIDVAVYYPETMNQLDDATFRHLYAWGFNPRVREIRRVAEVDYLDERLIRDGFLDRYKVLTFVWGDTIEKDVLAIIDDWMRRGGTVIYPSFPKGNLMTVEGDASGFQRWSAGDTGEGTFRRFPGDMEPPSLYGEFVEEELRGMDTLHPWTQLALAIEHPAHVFFSVQEDGHVLVLNYGDAAADIRFPDGTARTVPAYGIARYALPAAP